jgi:hypothetical protein
VGLAFSQVLFKDRRFWQVAGVLTESDDGIHVEWQSDEYERPWGKAAASHVERGPIKSIVIPWSSVETVSFRGKFFGPGTLRITARSLAALEGLPGVSGNVWWVRVARPERRNAREFVLVSETALSNASAPLLSNRRR